MIKRILKMDYNLSIPLKAALWFTLCRFLQKAIGILTTPFITRLLSTDEYGRISTFASWESIFMVIVTFSSGHVVMNLCVKYEKRDMLLASLTGYNLVLSFIWGIVSLLTVGHLKEITGMSNVFLAALYLSCVFQNIINCWVLCKQYEYHYIIVVIQTLLYTVGSGFGGLLGVACVSRSAEAYIIPRVMSSVLIGLIVTICIFKKNRSFYNSEIWKYTFGFCVPLLPHYLSEIILMGVDKIMIDKMCGSADVAVYSIAYSVGSLVSMVTMAINSAFIPYQYQKIKDKKLKILAQNTNYIIGFVAVILCSIMLFGREIVFIVGGRKYMESVSLIVPIGLGAFFNYVFQLFARIQEYFEQKYTIVIASVSCAALNILLNYIFINLCGYKAAAYTTFICYFVFCFLHYMFSRKVCKKYIGHEIYDIKKLVIISGVFVSMSILIQIIDDLYILKYAVVLVMIWGGIQYREKIFQFVKAIQGKE